MRNITFGIASFAGSPGEFDIIVCLRTSVWEDTDSTSLSRKNLKQETLYNCSVLAVVEAKRNPDDIGTAFSGLQPTMAWLCGRKVNLELPSSHSNRKCMMQKIGPIKIIHRDILIGNPSHVALCSCSC